MARLFARRIKRHLRDGDRDFELTIERLELQPGNRKAIVGASGCGKTTAMDLLALASQPDSADDFTLTDDQGSHVDVRDLLLRGANRELASMRSHFFGYVVQSSALFPFLNVAENIELSQRLAGVRDANIVRHLLSSLELPSATAMPGALSMGQRQRVAVARALAHRPAFLLADEPTASLDPMLARRTLDVCDELLKDSGGAMLLITHNRDLAVEKNFEVVEPEISATAQKFTHSVIDDSRLASVKGSGLCGSFGLV